MTQWVPDQGSREQVSFVLHRVVISSEMALTLRRFAQCNRILPALVMLTAYAATVLRWCDQSELTLAVVDHGRYRADLMSLVGCLANHLHLRVAAPGNQTLEDLLGAVNREFSAAARNRDFDQVTRVVPGLHTDLYFNWFPPRSSVAQEVRAADGRGPAITVEPMPLTLDSETLVDVRNALPFKLMLACSDEQQGIAADLWYTTDLFNAESMQSFAKNFYLILQAVLELPTTHVGSISIEP